MGLKPTLPGHWGITNWTWTWYSGCSSGGHRTWNMVKRLNWLFLERLLGSGFEMFGALTRGASAFHTKEATEVVEVSSIGCLWTYPTGRRPWHWSNIALKKQFGIEYFRCLCYDPPLVVSRAITALKSLESSGSNHLKAIMFSFRFDIRRDRALWRQDQFVVVVAAVVAVNKQFLKINNRLFAEHTNTTWWHLVSQIILSLINF